MSTPADFPVVLCGYGPVGRAYAAELRRRRAEFRSRYGADVRVVAIRGRRTQVVLPADGQVPPRPGWSPLTPLADTVTALEAAAVAQAVPSGPDVVDTAVADGFTALRSGAHLVTATKSGLLRAWRDLDEAGKAAGRCVRLSGATGAALPAGDLARSALRGFSVVQARGCLNGTATFVLDRLAEGQRLDDAVRHARRLGIAESDPSADLSGTDTATKMRLIGGLLWGWDVSAASVRTEPITAGTAARARAAATRDARLRQVGLLRAEEPNRVVVGLHECGPGDPLRALTGPEKAVTYSCGEAGEVTVSGGRSSPLGAALAMVKDTLSLAVDPAPGMG